MKVLNLTQLVNEYDKHVGRILNKCTDSKGLTHARKQGVRYYVNAGNAVQDLFDQPWIANSTPGFVMRTAAQLALERVGYNPVVGSR